MMLGAVAFRAANNTAPPDGKASAEADISAVTGKPSSGCCPIRTRPLAGSTANHTRYQRAACIDTPVAISTVAPSDAILAVAPFAPISRAMLASPVSSASNT